MHTAAWGLWATWAISFPFALLQAWRSMRSLPVAARAFVLLWVLASLVAVPFTPLFHDDSPLANGPLETANGKPWLEIGLSLLVWMPILLAAFTAILAWFFAHAPEPAPKRQPARATVRTLAFRGLVVIVLGLSGMTLEIPGGVERASAADVPTDTNVAGGGAFVDETSVGNIEGCLHLGDGNNDCNDMGDDAAWDDVTTPGGSYTLEFNSLDDSVGFNLPDGDDADDVCRGRIFWDDSATQQIQLFSAGTCPAEETEFTVWCTDTGLSGGSPRAGTLRIRLDWRNDLVGVGQQYVADSDDRAAGLFAGALRCPLAVTAVTSNAYPAGSTYAYTVAGESMTFTMTHTRAAPGQTTTSAAFKSFAYVDGSEPAGCATTGQTESNTVTINTGGTTTASTFTVSDTYPAGVRDVSVGLTVTADAGLTGVDWTHFQDCNLIGDDHTSTDVLHALIERVLDPRVTATHLLQVNDNAFGTPPMSKNEACDCRLTSDLGFLASRFTNARSEGLAGASFAFSQTMQDTGQLTSPDTGTGLGVSTQGGQAGWGALRAWSATLPSGSWTKTLDITGPAAIDSNAHLVSATKTYSLLAANPDVHLVLDLSPVNSGDSVNFQPGAALEAHVFAVNSQTQEAVTFDTTPIPRVALFRVNGAAVEVLDITDNTWDAFGSGPVDFFPMAISTDGFSYRYVWPALNTTSWGTFDISAFSRAYVDTVPYGENGRIAVAFGGNTSFASTNVTGILDISPLTDETHTWGNGQGLLVSLFAVDHSTLISVELVNDTFPPSVAIFHATAATVEFLNQSIQWQTLALGSEPYRWNLTSDADGNVWRRSFTGTFLTVFGDRDLSFHAVFEDANLATHAVTARITNAEALTENDTVQLQTSFDQWIAPAIWILAMVWSFRTGNIFLGVITVLLAWNAVFDINGEPVFSFPGQVAFIILGVCGEAAARHFSPRYQLFVTPKEKKGDGELM